MTNGDSSETGVGSGTDKPTAAINTNGPLFTISYVISATPTCGDTHLRHVFET
jgi:hypothetical protein